MHTIAAKAVCFKEALEPGFVDYQKQVVANAHALAEGLKAKGFKVVSDGTDNHLLLVDVRNKNFTGKVAEKMLDEVGVTVNKNTVPNETESPFVTSGLRLGTAAVTTRGFLEADMKEVAEIIDLILREKTESAEAENRIKALCDKYPLYPSL